MIIIYIFGGLLLVFLLLTLLAPGRFQLLRTGEVGCSTQQLLSFVADFNNYSEWNPWLTRDDSVKITIDGQPGKPGHSLSWKGRRTGSGKIELVSLNENSIHWLIQYEQPWKTRGNDLWNIKQLAPGKCEISWQHEGNLPWPFARLMGGFIRRNLGYQHKTALENLGSKFA